MRLPVAVLCVMLGGCEQPATQLVVLVDTDLGDELTQLHVQVSAGRSSAVNHEVISIGDGPDVRPFPISFGVSPPNGRVESDVRIELSGLDTGDETLVSATARAAFIENQSLLLPMYLWQACRGLICPEESSCDVVAGRPTCRPVLRGNLTAIAPGTELAPKAWVVEQGEGFVYLRFLSVGDGGEVYIGGTAGPGGPIEARVSRYSREEEQRWRWSTVGEPSTYLQGMTRSSSGTIYAVGSFRGAVDIGDSTYATGALDAIFVVALDGDDGHVLFSRSFRAEVNVGAVDLIEGPAGEILVLGRSTGLIDFGLGDRPSDRSTFLVALSPIDGTTLWDWVSEGADQTPRGLMREGNRVVVVGLLTGTLPAFELAVAENQAGFFAAFDATSGTPLDGRLWARARTLAVSDVAFGSGPAGPGLILITGTVAASEPIDFGGGPRTVHSPRGAYAVAYEASTGEYLWDRTFGSDTGRAFAQTIAVSPSGTVFLGGSLSGRLSLGGPVREATNSDPFVAWLDPADGTYLGDRAWPGEGNDSVTTLAVGPFGHPWALGLFNDDLTIGETTLTTPLYGVFLARFPDL